MVHLRPTVLALLASLAALASPLRAEVRCVPLSHPGPCDSYYATIQEAVNAAAVAGDVVQVAAGVYHEQVLVSGKSLQLKGARAGTDARGRSGPESWIVHDDGPLTACGNDILVDGFTIAGATNPSGGWGGLTLNQSLCGAVAGARIENNIVRDNIVGIYAHGTAAPVQIRANWIRDNSAIPEFGSGIESGGERLEVHDNRFQGNAVRSMTLSGSLDSAITGNRFDLPIVLVQAVNLRVERNVAVGGAAPEGLIVVAGGGDGINLTENTLNPSAGRALVIDDRELAAPNQHVLVRDNCLGEAGIVGLEITANGHSGVLLATDNWWGSPTGPSGVGPGAGASIVDPGAHATFTPYRTGSICACLGQPNGVACDDGDICTLDSCGEQGCVATPRSCDDQNSCTEDRCDAVYGCENTVVGCNDNNLCTIDGCDASGCTFTPRVCNDNNPCTTDSCHSGTGQCTFTPACGDGNPCTIDGCDASGCTYTPRVCNDNNLCTTDSCNSGTGQCAYTPACGDGNPCTDDACNPATGACVHTNDDAASCAIPNQCTVNVCSAGTCVPVGPASCDDGIACTTDGCNAAGFCTHTPVNSVCGPTTACGYWECNPTSGCISHRTGGESTPCDDGDACTTRDRCHFFLPICQGTLPVTCGSCAYCDHAVGCVQAPCTSCFTCPQGSSCTQVPCNAPCMRQTGCIIAFSCILSPDPNASCTDGNPCTTDHCTASGQCASSISVPPGEVSGVTFGADSVTLGWTPDPRQAPGIQYDVARGEVAALPVGSAPGESCESVGNTTNLATAEIPDAGNATWYLVRARDGCGLGTYGDAVLHGSPPVQRVPACP